MPDYRLEYARPGLTRVTRGAGLGWLSVAVTAVWVTLAGVSAMTGWREPLWLLAAVNPATGLAAAEAARRRGGGAPAVWAVVLNGMVVAAVVVIVVSLGLLAVAFA